ncbi:MAG TPA: hypothetical protein VFU69_15390, partial [Ktedonobacterales bacterium]|nr:hypothetical protein [Ktedonobacterales bacterium]
RMASASSSAVDADTGSDSVDSGDSAPSSDDSKRVWFFFFLSSVIYEESLLSTLSPGVYFPYPVILMSPSRTIRPSSLLIVLCCLPRSWLSGLFYQLLCIKEEVAAFRLLRYHMVATYSEEDAGRQQTGSRRLQWKIINLMF